jgi:FtsH-binding integral membrane protein
MSFLDNDNPRVPYAPSPMAEPLPHWTARMTQRISDNVWPLLGALFLVTSSGLWLLFTIAYLFAAGGEGHVVVTSVEAFVVGVMTFLLLVVCDTESDDEKQAVHVALVLAWTHLAAMTLSTVAITVFA